MDRLDLLAVQGTLRSILQHHSSEASILRRSAFFTVQLSAHPKKVKHGDGDEKDSEQEVGSDPEPWWGSDPTPDVQDSLLIP